MSQPKRRKEIPLPRRKACNACAQAKVRCDNETRSCTRCQVRRIQCIYPGSATSSTAEICAVDHSVERHSLCEQSTSAVLTDDQADYGMLGPGRLAYATPDSISEGTSGHGSSKSLWENNSNLDERLQSSNTVGQTGSSLVCTIDASAIQNRWIKAFISDPNHQTKNTPPAVHAYMARILKSYVSAIIRSSTLPPFVHETQVTSSETAQPLANCISLLKLCTTEVSGSKILVLQLLEQEMSKVFDFRSAYDAPTLLGAFQAYLIYVMAFYFHLDQQDSPLLRQYMINLQQLACETSEQGLVTVAELDSTRPHWDTWIIAEAKRRTIYTMYLFDNLLSARDNLPVFIATELRGLPAPAGKTLWRGKSVEAWRTTYNSHLSRWAGGYLLIDELYATPSDFSHERITERRRRVDMWLEDVDEYGTSLFAMSSASYGG